MAGSAPEPEEPVPISVKAERLVVRTDHREWENGTPLHAGDLARRYTTNETYVNATLASSEIRMSYGALFAPYPGRAPASLNMAGGRLGLTGLGPDTVVYNYSAVRSDTTFEVPHAQHIDDDGEDARLDLAGDLMLSFWEWDLVLTDANGTRVVRSGYEYDNTIDNPLGRNGFGDKHSRYVTIFATNATLTMDPTDVPWGHMTLYGERLTATGDVRLRDAVARSSGQDTGQDRTLTAPVDLALDRYEQDDDRFMVKAWVDTPAPDGDAADGTSGSSQVGDTDAVVAEGPGIPPESGRQDGYGTTTMVWGTVAATVLVAAVLWLAGRSLFTRRIVVLRRAMAAADYGFVARAGPLITRSRRHAAEVAVMKTVALLKLDRVDDADGFLATIDAQGRLDPATTAYLEACIAVGKDDLTRAREALALSLKKEPGLREAALRNPYLSTLVKETVASPAGGDDLDGYA